MCLLRDKQFVSSTGRVILGFSLRRDRRVQVVVDARIDFCSGCSGIHLCVVDVGFEEWPCPGVKTAEMQSVVL